MQITQKTKLVRYQYLQYFMLPKHLRFEPEVMHYSHKMSMTLVFSGCSIRMGWWWRGWRKTAAPMAFHFLSPILALLLKRWQSCWLWWQGPKKDTLLESWFSPLRPWFWLFAFCRVAPGRQYTSTTTSRCWSLNLTQSQMTPILSLRSVNYTEEGGGTFRHDICHKHHKQRLCKIISVWVKFHFVNVLEQFMYVSF